MNNNYQFAVPTEKCPSCHVLSVMKNIQNNSKVALVTREPNTSSDTFGAKRESGLKNKEPEAFQRTAGVQNSLAYMGSIISFLAEGGETAGRFAFMEYRSRPGTEPPPHIHEWEHELIYVMEGTMQFFCEDKAMIARPGEMVFIPRGKPHAFYILSENVRALGLIVQATDSKPLGLDRYFRAMGEQTLSMELPDGAVTYAEADLQQAQRIANEVGCRLLSPEETAAALPLRCVATL